MSGALFSNYTRLPVQFAIGQGAWLWDTQGRRYLDAMSGVAVCSLGHAHPAVTAAIVEQAQTLLHTSNWYQIPLQERLGQRLTALSGLDKAFFCNSGTEAIEAAIKIARKYGHGRGIAMPEIIVMENAFHGRTLAALTATGNRNAQAGFEPLVAGFTRVPYNDVDAILAAATPSTVAILVEPVQGEGGVHVPAAEYLNRLRALCDERGWLLMLDEIQTGIGRTGAWFAFQHNHIVPDVLCLAKALGNGMPIGACLAHGAAADCLGPGSHGSTFGGNPLACRVALAVLDVIEQQELLDKVKADSAYLLSRFHQALDGKIKEIRAHGLLIGLDLGQPCGGLMRVALDNQLLINVTASSVVRLLPPFVMTEAQLAQLAEGVIALVEGFLAQAPGGNTAVGENTATTGFQIRHGGLRDD